MLAEMYIPIEAICCKDTNYMNEQHVHALNDLYDYLTRTIMAETSGMLARINRYVYRGVPV